MNENDYFPKDNNLSSIIYKKFNFSYKNSVIFLINFPVLTPHLKV